MEYKAEDYIKLIEQRRFDKIGAWAMEIIAKKYRRLQEQRQELPIYSVSNSLVADIRNKLTPPNNLCAMLKDRDVDPFIGDDPRNGMIDKEIEQTLNSIKYLSNL